MNIQTPSLTTSSLSGARRGVLVVLPMAVCAILLGACGSSGSSGTTVRAKVVNLNTPHVAAAIEQSILNQRHVHAKVSCPVKVPQVKGRTFVCIATVSEGSASVRGKTPFTVTIQNSKGYVTYKAD